MNMTKKLQDENTKKGCKAESSLAEILFEIGKSGCKDSPDALLEFIEMESQERPNPAERMVTCSPAKQMSKSLSGLIRLRMDEIDISIISFLWYKHIEGSYRNEVSGLLRSVFDSPVLAYRQIGRIRTLLHQGIIQEDSDVSGGNFFMPYLTTRNDKNLYKMDICLGQSMLDFIVGKSKQFKPYADLPFTSDDEHLQTWIHLWEVAYKLYQNKRKKSVFDQPCKLKSLPLMAEMLACLHQKEACTPTRLRFKAFCEKHRLSDEETLLLIMLLKLSLAPKPDIFTAAFDTELEDYYSMHELTVDRLNKSNLRKHDILYYTLSDPEIEEPLVHGMLSIRAWVKQELSGKPAPVKKVSKPRTDADRMEEFSSAGKMFDILTPRSKLTDLIISPALTEALGRIVNFKQNSTLAQLCKWGVEGFSKHQHRGYTALFHGGPGTGKTLAADVIAAETGKQILKTDSALILSKYFGDAEKNAKKVFSQYYELCDQMINPPILLLNEADQLLNRRGAETVHGTDKAWNALQNIFLEALEQPKGIIIATTNLISCLDSAYSRRFDTILEFPPPGEAERYRIWQVRLPQNIPGLADLDVSILARYNLTGGQINKVIRNACLQLAGATGKSKKITTQLLSKFCEQEKKQAFEIRQNKPANLGISKVYE